MKSLYFLVLLAVSQAFVMKNIPKPTLVSLTVVDPPGFVVQWTPVKTEDPENPILGYKVNVWQQDKVKQYHYETVNGVKVLVEDYVPVKFPNTDKIPESKPKEILVNGADEFSAKVEPIETGITYQIRVQAYTKSGDGPLSDPMSIQILPAEKDHKKDVYTVA